MIKATPRAAPLAKDFAEALSRSTMARAAFEALPPSHQREYILYIDEARKAETRARRIAKTVAQLEKSMGVKK